MVAQLHQDCFEELARNALLFGDLGGLDPVSVAARAASMVAAQTAYFALLDSIGPSCTGAGFSGTLVALNLLRQAPAGTHISLIERGCAFGPGLAYSTANSSLQLNVPAGRMSAFEDAPRGFLVWLQRRAKVVVDEGAFVPRQLYGAYLQHLLDTALQQRTAGALELVRDNVEAVARNGSRLRLTLGSGRTLVADIAVLPMGNTQPEPPTLEQPALYDSSCWRPDPWAADAFSDLDPNSAVMLIGSGLTMVDAVISLLDRGHVGPIHAISRRGLLLRHLPIGSMRRAPAGSCASRRGGSWAALPGAIQSP